MKVIFVCTGNICRSPMAEALARHLERRHGSDIEFGSAGIAAIVGAPATRTATDVMAELEIPLRWHRARQLTGDLVAEADLLVGLDQEHVDYVNTWHPEARVELLDRVPDPYGLDVDTYRAVRDQIAAAIAARAGNWLDGG